MYPSDEMEGSVLLNGSSTKDTLTMSLGGSWFCEGVALVNMVVRV